MIPGKILSTIKGAGKLAILPHVFADGDALGSSLALGIALKKLGKAVTVFLEEDIPYIYDFLPGKDLVEVYKGGVHKFDAVIALDTGDIDRLGTRVDVFKSFPITINIDHHKSNTEFAFYNYVETGASAVGEIVYQMLKTMGVQIDSEISTCLYVAITTDTGGFRYSNTTSVTHQIAGDLIKNGVNVSEISQRVFESTSLEKVKLTGLAISSLEIFENGKVAFLTVPEEMMKMSGAKEEDCEGIVNIGRNIVGVEVAAMFRQRQNGEIKVNLRSNNYVDVSSIAGMFGGGGHKRAAGFTSPKSMEEVKKLLLKDINEVLW